MGRLCHLNFIPTSKSDDFMKQRNMPVKNRKQITARKE